MSLAQTIKKQREVLSLTQEELAQALGLKRVTIATYERGGAKPSLDVALKMARLFSMPMEALLDETPMPEESPAHA